MGDLNSFSAGEGGFEQKFSKNSNARGEGVARRGDVEASILMFYNVGFIRKYLTPDSAKIIVQALLFLNLITV